MLVVPVEFSNVGFTYDINKIEDFLNAGNFNFENADGSVSEYFSDQFGSSLRLEFCLAPIVTLSRERAYYGGDNSLGEDSRPYEMVKEACGILDGELDFSSFDNDATGLVQHLIFLYAGEDEALGGPSECLWSQCLSLKEHGGTVEFDGVAIDIFACTSELGAEGKLSGIGRFCHELLHTFGLPDFYDNYIPQEKAYYSAALWNFTSIMDGGWRNNGEHTPPALNAVERYLLGVGPETELQTGTTSLYPISEGGAYARLDCPEQGECFLFECRRQSQWDRFIGGEGMLVYHLDRTGREVGEHRGIKCSASTLWDFNLANIFPSHQCIDLVEASGKSDRILRSHSIEANDLPDIFFPTGGKSFGPYTNPEFKSWYSGNLGLSVNQISTGSSGRIEIKVGEESTAIDRMEVFQDAVILDWTCKQGGLCKITLDSDVAAPIVLPRKDFTYSYMLQGLEPGSTHEVTVTDSNGYSVKTTFTTRNFDGHSRPRILTDSFQRDDQGFIKAGSRVCLRLENAPGEKVFWFADNQPLVPDSDGRAVIERSVTLKAKIFRVDSQTFTIIKELKVR